MMYFGANNSSVNCRQTLAIHVYIIAFAALMQLTKMLYSKSIVNMVTFKLKNDIIHDTPYYITNDNTKQHIQAQVKIQPENECIECECIE